MINIKQNNGNRGKDPNKSRKEQKHQKKRDKKRHEKDKKRRRQINERAEGEGRSDEAKKQNKSTEEGKLSVPDANCAFGSHITAVTKTETDQKQDVVEPLDDVRQTIQDTTERESNLKSPIR